MGTDRQMGDLERIFHRHSLACVSVHRYGAKDGDYWSISAWQQGQVLRIDADTLLLAVGQLLTLLEEELPQASLDLPSRNLQE